MKVVWSAPNFQVFVKMTTEKVVTSAGFHML